MKTPIFLILFVMFTDRVFSEPISTNIISALDSWTDSIQSKDANFGIVTSPTDPRHGQTIADKVYDSLEANKTNLVDAVSAVSLAQSTYDEEKAKREIASPPGRFQIISGTALTGDGDMHCIFKIDTTTGHTWMFMFSSKKNQSPDMIFVPVPSLPPLK